MGKWIVVIIAVAVAVWWFTRDPVEVAYPEVSAAGQRRDGQIGLWRQQ
ncbi:MAG: hypothetical protein H7A19_14730 [Rhodanobacteraceae bacterium]|nr:hypothetical protein [Rhodanobacteraceae bacterium]